RHAVRSFDGCDARRRSEAGSRLAHGHAGGAEALDGTVAVADGVREPPESFAALAGGVAERRDQLQGHAAEAQADVHGAAVGELPPPALGDAERVAPQGE